MSAPLVQCILLISDYASRATPLTIESRRGQAIQQIRSTLLQPETHALPATAVAIATLIVAEYRGGEMDAVQFHCRGLKSWVDARGGLDIIDAHFDPFTIMALMVAFVYFDVPLFDSTEELDAALDRLELLPVSTQETPATLKKYCFPSELGSQVAVLYVLSTVQQLGLDDVFAELAYRLETSAPVAPGAMLYMVVSAAWRYRRSHAALSTCRIAEFVSLLSLAPARARRRMLGGLSRRLTGTEMADRPIIPLEELRDEIRNAWALRGSEESPGSAGQPRSPTGLPLRNAGESVRRVCPYIGPTTGHAQESGPPGPPSRSSSSMLAPGHMQMSQLPSPTSTPSPHSSSSTSTGSEVQRRVCPYIPPRQTSAHEWS